MFRVFLKINMAFAITIALACTESHDIETTERAVVSGTVGNSDNPEKAMPAGSEETDLSNLTISLSQSEVSEALAVGSVVAKIQKSDETVSLRLNPDAAPIVSLESNELKLNSPLNYEVQNTIKIQIIAEKDGFPSYEKSFTLKVIDVQEAPTSLSLSNYNVPESQAAGHVVASLLASDEDEGESFSYSLVAGNGDTSNAMFAVAGSQLVSTAIFDFESATSHSIRLRVEDNNGLSYETAVNVNIEDVTGPVIHANRALFLGQNARLRLAGYLDSYHETYSNLQNIYRVTSLPTGGKLYKGLTELSVADEFTQQDIENGLIQYKHLAGTSDQFTLSLRDADAVYAAGADEGTPLAFEVMLIDECNGYTDATSWNEIGPSPYLICSAAQLVSLSAACSSLDGAACNQDFRLGTDIGMSGVAFESIGTFSNKFEGHLDGQGHSIKQLDSSMAVNPMMGLFNWVGDFAVIENLGIEDISLSNSMDDRVGALAGSSSGLIEGCWVTGTVAATNTRVGGMVGDLQGQLRKSFSTATVSGGDIVGGLVGIVTAGDVKHVLVKSASVSSGASAGGLTSTILGTSSISYATVDAIVDGSDGTGGFASRNNGTIEYGTVTGAVSHAGTIYAGGFVARNDGTIHRSQSLITSINVASVDHIGGFVGTNAGTISESLTITDMQGDLYVGGFVGSGDGAITDSYATGDVTASGGAAGGFAGRCSTGCSIERNYSIAANIVSAGSTGGFSATQANEPTTFTDNFWDTSVTTETAAIVREPEDIAGEIHGEPTTAMQTQATFTNWDFVDIWIMDEANTYPRLRHVSTFGK